MTAIELDIKIARLEEQVLSAKAAVSVALDAQKAHDIRANGLTDRLAEQYKEFIRNSISKDEYEKRHNDLSDRINVERDFRNKLLGISVIWPIIVAMLVAWLVKK